MFVYPSLSLEIYYNNTLRRYVTVRIVNTLKKYTKKTNFKTNI